MKEQICIIILIIILFIGFYLSNQGSGVSYQEENCIPDYIGGCN